PGGITTPVILGQTTVRGSVTQVDPLEQTFAIDTGGQVLTVETEDLGYDHFIMYDHVLGAEQEDLALAFARSGRAFDGLEMQISADGVPLLDACTARFECKAHALHDAGDHAIAVGLVTRAAVRKGKALVFCQGDFGTFDKGA
ncbi:MAG: flavin reductase family protein, partial [Rhodobacteraceae bacterium]|nr:flavin reductase family protein [Paracoccaceae bacterium]